MKIKNILQLIIIICFANYLSAQVVDVPERIPPDEDTTEIVPFYAVEIKPVFPGGDDAMLKFLMENIVYPEIEKEKGIQGLVVVSFVVEPDGSLTNIEVKKGVSPNINQEAIRVIELMPNWKPGLIKGEPVRVPVNLPLRFTLADDSKPKPKEKKKDSKKLKKMRKAVKKAG